MAVDFEADVPCGNWVTVGFDSPPGPSIDVHWGATGMEGKMKQERSQSTRKAMEELEKINGKGNARRKYMVRIGVPGRGV